jgi:endo-1,4-beta-xylanase
MTYTTGKRNKARTLAAWMAVVIAASAPLAAQTTTTLRQAAAARGIPIGAAAQADEYGETDPLTTNQNYVNILSTQYDQLEPGNAMKWDVTEPELNQYNFQPGDELVAFAQKYGMRVRGHNLCWHQQFPAWLQPYANSATPAQMATLLQNHITAEVTHYAGQVFAWDVVNEAFTDTTPSVLGDSIWYDQPGIGQSGTGYIEQAFRWAHAADPNALLFYNDYNIEGPGAKFNAVLAMVQDFVSRGVPIDGVGFEMHIMTNGYPSPSGLAQNMQALAALGIQVQITEMDVRVPVDSSGNATAAELQQQAQVYQNIMTVCLEQPNCTAFQVWGISYNDSWIPSVFAGYGAALPFDFNYQPTPAFDALLTALQTTTPPIHQNYVVNAASYQSAAVAPGEILTIYGASAGPASAVTGQTDASGKFPTNLGGVQVTFGGTPAPLLFAQLGQVNAVVPFEVAGQQQTAVQYQYNVPNTGLSFSNTVTMPVAAAAPAVFSLAENGSGPGAILNQDYSVNGASNPAAAGTEIQIFGTGGGAVVGGATDGAAWPAVLGSLVTQPVTATIGGVNAQVDYSGPAPYLVNGAIQVNLTIPSGLAPGPQPVVITVGTAQTQAGITVAVK